MAWVWTTNIAFNVAGALAMIAFGVFVATVRLRTPQASTVAGFAIAFGVATGAINLVLVVGHETAAGVLFAWLAVASSLATCVALLAMWWVLPSPRPLDARMLIIPGAFCVFGVAFASLPLLSGQISAPVIDSLGSTARLYFSLAGLSYGLWWGLVLLLAMRFARGEPDAGGAPFLAVALALYPATNAYAVFSADAALARTGWLEFALSVLVAAAWLWAGHHAQRPRPARAVAWTILGAALLGLLIGIDREEAPGGWGISGVARIATVALLSYAIVRHQVLGIDVKIRWTISRSTIAAAFLAVFFIASEAAQQFLGDSLGSAYVGIVAAGVLVFAIAPLQRAADRLAEKAVPTVAALAASTEDGRHRAYRLAVLAALRDDGVVGVREEQHLADLADELGVKAGDALRIRREASTDPEVRA